MHPIPLIWAQATGAGLTQMLPLVAVVVVMYFIMIRPQQKQAKDHQTLVSSLKKGDKVVMQGGLFGKVFAVADCELTLEIAAGVKVQVLKSSVQGKVNAGGEETVPAAKPEEK